VRTYQHFIHKLRFNEPLTKQDLDALEKMLIEAGTGKADDVGKLCSGNGLGLFVRSMVGLDREAAKRAFDGFLSGKTLTATQIQFVNLVIDISDASWMDESIAALRVTLYRFQSSRSRGSVRLDAGYAPALDTQRDSAVGFGIDSSTRGARVRACVGIAGAD